MLTNASAELNETEHWLDISKKCGYLSDECRDELANLCHKINGLIGGMIRKASRFCEQ